ncbi:acyl-CoA N-acyltransferase [Phellopilus nigrolimitatus]|nr:acyl-CoA N-acyltransferase [Phellopilus nigrolimitatus]
MHTQEVITVVLAPSLPNAADLAWYLLHSGLAPLPRPSDLPARLRHARGWLRHASDHASFPHMQSFTRSVLSGGFGGPGDAALRAVLGLHILDPVCKDDMDAFHRWMNDERVNSAWGRKGSWERHVEYNGARGYVELVWIKENHVAPYVPAGTQDYDRGHSPARTGSAGKQPRTARAWFRSITHYIFLAEARTARVVGEPKPANVAVVRTSIDAGMHFEAHSVMTMNLRERLIKGDMFH